MARAQDDLHAILTKNVGQNVEDADEETFSLFSQTIPSQNLGFVNSTAASVLVDIAGHECEFMQSPGLLNSTRKGGTTGAVVWKVSPAVARWLVSETNVLWSIGALNQQANVVELGCGIAGIIGICLHRIVATYILTDQEYVLKRLQANIDANMKETAKKVPKHRGKLEVTALDWEHDSASNLQNIVGKDAHIDLVVACDCIYNDFLVLPFVETCVDVCKLSQGRRTLLLVAQQLRSDDVMKQWLSASMRNFDIWRVPDEHISSELASGSGYVIHLLLLKADD